MPGPSRTPAHREPLSPTSILFLPALLGGALSLHGCRGDSARTDQPLVPPAAAVEEPQATPPSGAPSPSAPPALVALRAEGPGRVVVEVTRQPGVPLPPGGVPFTAEPYNISAEPREPTVREADILGTGFALDLDGDGATGGALAASCDPDGSGRLGDARVPPLMARPPSPEGPTRYTYTPREEAGPIGRIAPSGAYAVLYGPCDGSYVSFGLSPSDQPLAVRTTPGPVVQVLVFEPVAAAGDEPRPGPFAIRDGAGEAAEILTGWNYEPLFGPDPAWASMRWAMIPLAAAATPQQIAVDLPEDGVTRLVVAAINVSPEPGIRLRFPPEVRSAP